MSYPCSYFFFSGKVKCILVAVPMLAKSSVLFPKIPENTMPLTSVWGTVWSCRFPPLCSSDSELEGASVAMQSLFRFATTLISQIGHFTESSQSWVSNERIGARNDSLTRPPPASHLHGLAWPLFSKPHPFISKPMCVSTTQLSAVLLGLNSGRDLLPSSISSKDTWGHRWGWGGRIWRPIQYFYLWISSPVGSDPE